MADESGERRPVLVVHGARKRFGNVTALDDLALYVERGEWVGLLGPNGAGKTTLVRAIAGRVRLDAGTITRSGAGRLGLVPQDVAIYPFLTTRENLEVFGGLHGLSGPALADRVAWALDWTGLGERADDRTAGFSGGMKRRLNLACAVLHRPDLILLDEPTTGVDPQSRERIFAMLAGLRADGAALLHTTHQLGEAEGVCQRIVIIDRGRIVAEGAPDVLVERTLGRSRTVVVTLDRAPVPGTLPAALAVEGCTLRAGIDDLVTGLPALLAGIAAAGIGVEGLRVERPDLEAVFLHLTGRELRE